MGNPHQLMENKIHIKHQLKKAYMVLIHHSRISGKQTINLVQITDHLDFLLTVILNIQIFKIKDNKNYLLKIIKIVMRKNK